MLHHSDDLAHCIPYAHPKLGYGTWKVLKYHCKRAKVVSYDRKRYSQTLLSTIRTNDSPSCRVCFSLHPVCWLLQLMDNLIPVLFGNTIRWAQIQGGEYLHSFRRRLPLRRLYCSLRLGTMYRYIYIRLAIIDISAFVQPSRIPE